MERDQLLSKFMGLQSKINSVKSFNQNNIDEIIEWVHEARSILAFIESETEREYFISNFQSTLDIQVDFYESVKGEKKKENAARGILKQLKIDVDEFVKTHSD